MIESSKKVKTMNNEQIKLMEKLKLPTSFDGLSDDELIRIEDHLADEMQLRGINNKGDGLNCYGKLCLSSIESIPDN